MSLANKKLYYRRLWANDKALVETFGNDDQKKMWQKGGDCIVNAEDEKSLSAAAQIMGDIRKNVHTANVDDPQYRLAFLSTSNKSTEQIKSECGEKVGEAIKILRNE